MAGGLDLFKLPLQVAGTMMAPWQMMGGPMKPVGDLFAYNAKNPINPFSIGSLAKIPGYAAGAVGTVGNSIGGGISPNLPNGQENVAGKAMMMRNFLSKLGRR